MKPLGRWDENPLIVIWEVTRACALACRHCRAEAIPRRDPRELSTQEAEQFVDQVVEAKPRFFVLTGGDPMSRPDILDIVRYATKKGLEVALSPSATPRFLRADLNALREAGLRRISLSIDGASKETHDKFRGVRGTWDWTFQGIEAARKAGIEFQINTTFTRQNISEFDQFANLMRLLRPALWSVFQLVPTGRATQDDILSAAEMEDLFERLYRLSREVDFPIKTTEGQHYRRVAWQHWLKNKEGSAPSMVNTNDGRGFVFISHTGDVCPSGFLPIAAGNVRTRPLLDIYRNSPVFQALRDSDQLKGKCGVCEWRKLCGGSRARAFAMTGDYLAEEPLCVYQPNPARSASAPVPAFP